jgi:hypothetical protein
MTCNSVYTGTTTSDTPTSNYSLVIPAGGGVQQVTLSTCGSAFDTMLTVYDASDNVVSYCKNHSRPTVIFVLALVLRQVHLRV